MTKRHGLCCREDSEGDQEKLGTIRVWKEQSWRRRTTLVRPDITIVDESKVTIPYECSND